MKIGEIFGTGKVVTLSKGSYYIDGELTNIDKLREYDKAGILQWDSSELRELALGLDASTQPLGGTVFCEECGTKQFEDAKFCEECGATCADRQPSSSQAKQINNRAKDLLKRFNSLTYEKKAAICVAAVVLTIVGINVVNQTLTSIEERRIAAEIAAEEERVAQLFAAADLVAVINDRSTVLTVRSKSDYVNERFNDQVVRIGRDGMVEYSSGAIAGDDSWRYVAHRQTGSTTIVSFPADGAGGHIPPSVIDINNVWMMMGLNAESSFPAHFFVGQPRQLQIVENAIANPDIFWDGRNAGTTQGNILDGRISRFEIDISVIPLSDSGASHVNRIRNKQYPDSSKVFVVETQELTTLGELIRTFEFE